jgi:hypothetical protein
MTVGELIARLQRYPEDAEVRLMCQPDYPFEYSVDSTIQRSEIPSDHDDDDFDDEDDSDVFILEGEQLGYGTSNAW